MADALQGREIVVAGGSGGLGSVALELLAAEGARLVVSCRLKRERAERWRGRAEIILPPTSVVAATRVRPMCPAVA